MTPRRFLFGQEPAAAPISIAQRNTAPIDPPSPAASSGARRPTEADPAPWRESSAPRLTEPLSMAPRGAVLPFRSAVQARGARPSEPSEDAPDRPAVMPAEAIPESSRRMRERAELRAFCLFLLAVLLIGNLGFWFALALLPTPKPAPVVAPSLPAVFLAALASSSTPAPEPSAASAVTSSAAPLAASAAPVVAVVPPHSASPRVRAPASPAPSAAVPRPPRPTSTSGIVDPWGGDQ